MAYFLPDNMGTIQKRLEQQIKAIEGDVNRLLRITCDNCEGSNFVIDEVSNILGDDNNSIIYP